MLVAFLDEYEVGYEFERWPHHITILPWFKANRQALEALAVICLEHLPIVAEVGEASWFGFNQDIAVNLVDSESLISFHRALLNRPGVLGLKDSRHTGPDYRPHITLQGQNDPQTGQELTISSIYLIARPDSTHRKRVEQVYSASHQNLF